MMDAAPGGKGPRHGRGPLAPLLIAALGALAAAPAAAGPAELRWKLEPGQTLRYSVSRAVALESKPAEGQAVRTERRQEVELTWVVGRIEGGAADVVMTIDRVRVRERVPGRTGEFDYDTAGPPPGDLDPFSARLVELIKGLVGAEVPFRMSLRGEVSDVKPPPALLSHIRQVGAVGGATLFTDEGLRNLIVLASPRLPEGPVDAGAIWTCQEAAPLPMFGVLIADKTFTDRGPRPGEPDVREVGVDVRYTFRPAPEAAVEMKILMQSGEGSFAIDARRGRIESGRFEESMTTTVSALGQRVEQALSSRLELRLLPDDAPRPPRPQ